MSWRDSLVQGAWRGVAFLTFAHDVQLGRRSFAHEYPGRDVAWVEDLGGVMRVWRVEAFLLGPDYHKARDTLIEAIEKPGPGWLDHPYLGKKQVMLVECRLSEHTNEGGMAQFSLSFAETAEPVAETKDTKTQAAKATEAAKAANAQSFTAQLTSALKTGAGWLREAAALVAGGPMAALGALAGGVLPVGELSAVATLLTGMRNNLSTVIDAPAAWAAQFNDALGLIGAGSLLSLPIFPEGVSATGYNPAQVQANALYTGPVADNAAPDAFEYVRTRQGLEACFVAMADDPVYDTRVKAGYYQSLPGGTLTAASLPADDPGNLKPLFGQFAAVAALVELSRQALDWRYESQNDAVLVRDALAERLELAAEAADDTLYPVLLQLRAALVEDLTARAASLLETASFTPAQTLPALVLAQLIHQDATREAELIIRNRGRIRHPGFVQGGQPLAVLER